MRKLTVIASLALATVAMQASAGLISSQSGAATYANGGGTGFGGTLGNGQIKFALTNSGANVDITLVPGGGLNDNVAILLDSKAGGIQENLMNDQGDGGRRAVSQPAANGTVLYPTDALPDYGLTIGGFGAVLFELNTGSTPNHLQFQQFNGAQTISIPLSSIGNPSLINFFALYTSNDTYMSNESLPADAGINSYAGPSAPNIGFDSAALQVSNYNQYVIPEPASLGLVSLAGLAMVRRRK